MWHNHFATSNLKVNNLHQMKHQNETLRSHAQAPFGALLHAMIRDPALLFWLHAPANRKGHPNENLARELMELFSIGIGNYTEQDVKEAARTLTGWTIRNGRFEERPALHNTESKTVLGQSGHWSGNDLVGILLQHPATAKRLAWRLTEEFFGENVVSQDAHSGLVEILRSNNLDIGSTVEIMLRSELFFSDANLRSRICDPVSFLVAPLRALDCLRPPPSTLIMAEWLKRMGQDLFYPPNVGGWNGGHSWLSTRTVISRTNYTAALAAGKLHSPNHKPDLSRLFQAHSDEANETDAGTFFAQVLGIESHDRATRHIAEQVKTEKDQFAAIVVALMTRPEAHLH